jgi:hypothetical protein
MTGVKDVSGPVIPLLYNGLETVGDAQNYKMAA